jgi:hypothetical protein
MTSVIGRGGSAVIVTSIWGSVGRSAGAGARHSMSLTIFFVSTASPSSGMFGAADGAR